MYNKSAYEKLKVENPEKLKSFRKSAYEKYKETNPEKLAEIRRKASARYYEKNKEKVIQQVRARQSRTKVPPTTTLLIGEPLVPPSN